MIILYYRKGKEAERQRWKIMMIKREATTEEIKVYKMVNDFMEALEEERFEQYLEKISDYVWSWGQDKRKAYDKCRKIAKEINCKVPDLATWYCIDEY